MAATSRAELEPPDAGPPSLGADLGTALVELHAPAFVVDRTGEIRWLNRSAIDLLGNQRGHAYDSIFAAHERSALRREFAKKILGQTRASSIRSTLRQITGAEVPVNVDCSTLETGGEIVGVLAIVHVDENEPLRPSRAGVLTPRQQEVLLALARGSSTQQIADALEVSRETVRNHVRDLLRALGVHSRLEAIVEARRRGLVD